MRPDRESPEVRRLKGVLTEQEINALIREKTRALMAEEDSSVAFALESHRRSILSDEGEWECVKAALSQSRTTDEGCRALADLELMVAEGDRAAAAKSQVILIRNGMPLASRAHGEIVCRLLIGESKDRMTEGVA